LQSGAQVWRVAGVAAAATSFSIGLDISWLGFGTSDQSFVMHYPWGLMRYFLVGYLAWGLLPEEFSGQG
jgi:hypothetical protein